MKIWEVPSGTALRLLIEWCVDHEAASHVLVSTQLDSTRVRYLTPAVEQSIRGLFAGCQVERFLATAWPANRLTSHVARIFVSTLDRQLIDRMCALGRSLEDWRHVGDPPLPEDVCLFRPGRTAPALVSCTHHGDAWIVSTKGGRLPGATRSDYSLEDLMIPDGEYFCDLVDT